MIQYSKTIKECLTECLGIEKLRFDIFDYLKEMSPNKYSENGYAVSIFNDDDLTSKDEIINTKDNIEIISYECRYEYGINFYFFVVVGIGNYVQDAESPAFFKIEKCLARLKYNDDLTLYDIEFSINNINKFREIKTSE